MRSTIGTLLFLAAAAMAQTPSSTAAGAPKELATISGRTVGANGLPLRKSNVTLRPMNTAGPNASAPQPYATTSNAEGVFTFDGVEPGTYLLMADHAGYVNSGYHTGKNAAGSTPIVLAPGQKMTDANIQLPQQSTISGRVLDEDGEPAARLQIRVLRQSYFNGRKRLSQFGGATSDENGDFKVIGLTAGKYFLSASPAMNNPMAESARRAAGDKGKAEEGPVTTFYPGTTDQNAAVAIDVTAGQNVAGMNLKMAKAAVFHVRGKASGAIPADALQRIRVIAQPRSADGVFSMEKSSGVAKDGSFDIAGLASGAYTVSLMRLEGQIQVLSSVSVNVSNQDTEGVSMEAVPPTDIPGTVTLEAGSAAPSKPESNRPGQDATARPTFRVSLAPMEGTIFAGSANAAAKDDGSFVLKQVSPGKYGVNVNGMPQGGYVKSVKFGGREAIDTGLDVTQGAAGTLEITVSTKGGEVNGIVQDKDGKPQSGPVTLIPDSVSGTPRMDLYRQGASNDSGQFRLRGVPPGKYTIYSWAELEPGAQYDPDFMKLHQNEGQRVTVEESSTQQLTLVR